MSERRKEKEPTPANRQANFFVRRSRLIAALAAGLLTMAPGDSTRSSKGVPEHAHPTEPTDPAEHGETTDPAPPTPKRTPREKELLLQELLHHLSQLRPATEEERAKEREEMERLRSAVDSALQYEIGNFLEQESERVSPPALAQLEHDLNQWTTTISSDPETPRTITIFFDGQPVFEVALPLPEEYYHNPLTTMGREGLPILASFRWLGRRSTGVSNSGKTIALSKDDPYKDIGREALLSIVAELEEM